MSYSLGVGASSWASSFSSFTWNMLVWGCLLNLPEQDLCLSLLLLDPGHFWELGEADLAVEDPCSFLCYLKGVSRRFCPLSTTKASEWLLSDTAEVTDFLALSWWVLFWFCESSKLLIELLCTDRYSGEMSEFRLSFGFEFPRWVFDTVFLLIWSFTYALHLSWSI